jgi:hypothetical protein
MKHFLVVLLIAALADSLSIQDASVYNGDGEDELEPAMEGKSVSLRCTLSVNTNENWVLCSWTHELAEGIVTPDNEKLEVVCSTANNAGTGDPCGNQGGSSYLQDYAKRLTMEVGYNFCGLKISDANAYDTGEWKCHVSERPDAVAKFSVVELFVSNQSELWISEPDLQKDDSQTILYGANDNNAEIEATCRAVGGRPIPKFQWFINDDRTEIDESDLKRSVRESMWNGVPVIEETITWEPTIDQMCDNYDIKEDACQYSSASKRNEARFTFDLICQVDQTPYYKEGESAGDPAIVVVEWNGSSSLYASLPLLLLASAAAALTKL